MGAGWYMWAYLGTREELEAWVKTQVEAWDHRVRILVKISKRHPQWAYASLGVSLRIKWK